MQPGPPGGWDASGSCWVPTRAHLAHIWCQAQGLQGSQVLNPAGCLHPPWGVGVPSSRAPQMCGTALTLLQLQPKAEVPLSPLSPVPLNPGRVVAAAALSAGAASRLEMSFVKA